MLRLRYEKNGNCHYRLGGYHPAGCGGALDVLNVTRIDVTRNGGLSIAGTTGCVWNQHGNLSASRSIIT
tara:strand:- start:93 stop:299 length:207 start_codon:yes stop_codon:yes gene_type:complete